MIDREKKRLDELLKGLDDTDSGLSSSEVCKLGLSMTLSFLIFITPSAFQPKLTLFPLEDILCIKTLMFSKLFPQRNMFLVLPETLGILDFYFLGLNKDLTGPEHLGPAHFPFSCVCLCQMACSQVGDQGVQAHRAELTGGSRAVHRQ